MIPATTNAIYYLQSQALCLTCMLSLSAIGLLIGATTLCFSGITLTVPILWTSFGLAILGLIILCCAVIECTTGAFSIHLPTETPALYQKKHKLTQTLHVLKKQNKELETNIAYIQDVHDNHFSIFQQRQAAHLELEHIIRMQH